MHDDASSESKEMLHEEKKSREKIFACLLLLA
jgi:hypothetical protein